MRSCTRDIASSYGTIIGPACDRNRATGDSFRLNPTSQNALSTSGGGGFRGIPNRNTRNILGSNCFQLSSPLKRPPLAQKRAQARRLGRLGGD